MQRSVALFSLGVVLSGEMVFAQNDLASGEAVETFVPPKRVESVNPRYPRQYQLDGREGWVTVSYMVAPSGETYDATVIASSGDPSFQKSALAAIEKWQHTPAQLNGQPIDAGNVVSITFELSNASGASKRFVKLQRVVLKALEKDDQVAAEAGLRKLEEYDRNLYEEAYYHLTSASYFAKWGSVEQQYQSLVRAAFFDKGREYLPADALTSVMFNKLVAELKLSYLGQAHRTANQLLERQLTPAQRERVEALVSTIEETRAADQSILVKAVVGQDNQFSHLLLKSAFTFENVDGDLAELRLHCDKDYVGFVYTRNTKFSVDSDLKDCWLVVIGDPGTQFDLLEL